MFNTRIKIKELLAAEPKGQEVIVMGWVRTFRNNQFVALNDGSTNNNLQVVIELGKYEDEFLKRITTSSSLKVKGTVIESCEKSMSPLSVLGVFSKGKVVTLNISPAPSASLAVIIGVCR